MQIARQVFGNLETADNGLVIFKKRNPRIYTNVLMLQEDVLNGNEEILLL